MLNSMTQSQRKSIEQLLKMTPQEWIAYFKTLPEAERYETNKELIKAVSNQNIQMMVDNLNSNAKWLSE